MTPLERRDARRRTVDAGQPESVVKLRRGGECRVVNVSHSGALLEGSLRLEPGRHVDVTLTARHGPATVRAHVMRVCVAEVRAEAIVYQAAVRFDRPIAV